MGLILLILAIAAGFVFSLLDAIEKIVRGVYEGKTKEEIDHIKLGIPAVIALTILVFLIAPK